MKFLSLFSGIGGMDLGLEWAGWECVGQVEIEPFAVSVLEKHWPNVKRWTDVRKLTASDVVRSVGAVDAIVGGFPCQPWSVAGNKLGANDPRHLWPEYYRLIKELRPRWVIGENVPGLLPRGADAVLADLEAQDYTCWPIVLGADNVGAPHRRKRVFFIARLADTNVSRLERRSDARKQEIPQSWTNRSWPARPGQRQFDWEDPRAIKPEMGSATHGSAREFSRWRKGALKGLGNMVVPQVAEVIGKIVLATDKECK